jgi:hypothetical protein
MIGSTHAFLFFFSKPFILSFLLDFSWHDCALILLKISDYLLFSKEYTKYVISTNNLNDLRMQTPKKIYKAIRPCWRFSRLDDGDPLSASAHRLSEQVCFTFLCFNKSVSLESSVDLHVKSILLWKKAALLNQLPCYSRYLWIVQFCNAKDLNLHLLLEVSTTCKHYMSLSSNFTKTYKRSWQLDFINVSIIITMLQ